MSSSGQSTPARSLADAEEGDVLQVRFVLFEFSPCRCWHVNVGTGDVLRHRGHHDGGVAVEGADGATMLVADDCARFIAVRPFRSREGTVAPPAPPSPHARRWSKWDARGKRDARGEWDARGKRDARGRWGAGEGTSGPEGAWPSAGSPGGGAARDGKR